MAPATFEYIDKTRFFLMISFFNRLRTFFSRTLGVVDTGYLRKWLIIAVLIGAVAGVGSILFSIAINEATKLFLTLGAGFTPPAPSGEGPVVFIPPTRVWMIPLVCALGGLISGFIVYRFAPEAEGQGTDSAIHSFHNKEGYIRRRTPVIKIIASAITIGSGGSAGREGPIALIGAGFGSNIADLLKLDSHDRRIALVVGIGAGIGSIFKAPLGGALIGAEILYRSDFEFEAVLPSFIASIVGYSIYGSWAGWQPTFGITTQFQFTHPVQIFGFALLGIICGLFGTIYGRTFYFIRNFFKRLKISKYLKPALGGLIVGIIGIFLPQVLGIGYGWVQFAMDGNTAALPLGIMVIVIFAKIVATGLSVGSGGSGGEFAPGIVIGSMVGGAAWVLLHNLTQLVPADPASFVVLGMMSLFGGIAKAPLALMLMVSEMTGNYSLLIPSMVSITIAYFFTGNAFIYEKQVHARPDSPAHWSEYSKSLFDKIRIADAMTSPQLIARPGQLLNELAAEFQRNRIDSAPVITGGKLVGVVTTRDMAKISEDRWNKTFVEKVMSHKLVLGFPDEPLSSAFNKMAQNHISHLPVVEPEDHDQMIGFLAIHNIAATYDSRRKSLIGD